MNVTVVGAMAQQRTPTEEVSGKIYSTRLLVEKDKGIRASKGGHDIGDIFGIVRVWWSHGMRGRNVSQGTEDQLAVVTIDGTTGNTPGFAVPAQDLVMLSRRIGGITDDRLAYDMIASQRQYRACDRDKDLRTPA